MRLAPRTLPSTQVLVVTGAILLAMLMGVAAASGKPLIVALVGGAMATLTLVAKPSLIFWLTTFVTLVLAGTVKFFDPELDRIWWLAYGMAALLYLPAFLHVLNRRGKPPRSNVSPLLSICIAVFLLDLIFASVAATSPPGQLAVTTKSLLMFSGVWAYLAWAELPSETVWKWIKVLFWIGALQILPTTFQYLFVRAARLDHGKGHGLVDASDSVVGTFGGSMDSGGLTAVLAFFLVAGLVIIIAMRAQNVLTRRQLLGYGFLFFFPLFLMEVKIVFFYLPVALIVMFRGEILRRPHVFIGWSCVAFMGLLVLLVSYQFLHWSVRSGSWESNMVRTFSYSFGENTDNKREEIGVMTRKQNLEFWWHEHGVHNIHETLIGHGMGASRTQGLAHGETAIKYAPLQLDRTGFCQMLWDVGVVGVLALLGAFYAMYRRCGALLKSKHLLPWQRALAHGLEALAPLYALCLLYRNDIPYAAPMMFIVMIGFGLTTWLTKQDSLAATEVRSSRTARAA